MRYTTMIRSAVEILLCPTKIRSRLVVLFNYFDHMLIDYQARTGSGDKGAKKGGFKGFFGGKKGVKA